MPAKKARSTAHSQLSPERHAGSLLVQVDPFLIIQRDKIITLAARYALPAIYGLNEFAMAGGLMSYGASLADTFRQLGTYAGKILNGAKPADLPVQQSVKSSASYQPKDRQGARPHRPTDVARPRRRGHRMTPRPPAGAPSSKQTVIKRYANRRLYNSSTGQYVSRKSLEEMARRGEAFVVEDTKSGEDITHSVLGQIIVAQEAVQTEPLLPTEFMRRLLTFYGDTLRTLLGCYLDFSLLTISDASTRNQMAEAGNSALKLMDEQVQQNIRFFEAMLLNVNPIRLAANPSEPTENEQASHVKGE